MWTTVFALAFVNVGLATTIVALMGTSMFLPLWVGLLLVAVGVVGLVLAVRFWQRYLAAMRR